MSASKELRRRLLEQALPLWLRVGFDRDNGHFVECLTPNAEAETSGRLRTRTAARVIYVYAHASALAVAPAGALDAAERAFAQLHEVAWREQPMPGYVRAFNRLDGSVLDSGLDLYDHACVLLALTWLHRATGDNRYAELAEQTLSAIDTTLAAPHGGWAEDDSGKLPRRQNPHMHLFESCLALFDNTANPLYQQRADELFELFVDRLFDRQTGVLREFFGPAWEVAPQFDSHRIEPGHMAEWVWLLRRYSQLCDVNVDYFCQRLMASVDRLGRPDGDVFLCDQVDVEGQVLSATRRLWPQVERIKSLQAECRVSHQARQSAELEALCEAVLDEYLTDTFPGTWRDQFSLQGDPLADTVPASSLYHLFTYVAEVA